MRSKKEQTEAKEGSGAGDSSFPAAPFPLLAAAAFGAPAIIPATASPDVGTPLANTYACVATKIKTNILTDINVRFHIGSYAELHWIF